ncbi:uncharacterized protein [Pocillopora verrucosa]|uniref:uncharacterized protein isoform X2 n=1 Tax=Pocillopora verrucosa TaxID=203993 RepID=UPI00333F811C
MRKESWTVSTVQATRGKQHFFNYKVKVFDTDLAHMVILRDEGIVSDLDRARSDYPIVESVQGNVPMKNPRRACRLHLRCQCLAERNFPPNALTPQDSIILNIVRLENLANRIHIEHQQMR